MAPGVRIDYLVFFYQLVPCARRVTFDRSLLDRRCTGNPRAIYLGVSARTRTLPGRPLAGFKSPWDHLALVWGSLPY